MINLACGHMWRTVLFLAATAAAHAAITEVIVYPQGAQVKEEETIALQQGENTIEWGTLSQGVDADSIRVKLPAGARLIDRTVKTEQVAVESGTKRAELEKALREADQKVRELNDHLALIAKDAEYLEQIQRASTTPVKGESAYAFPTPAQWDGLIQFTGERRGRLLADQRNTEANRDVAQREQAALRRELNSLDNSGDALQPKADSEDREPEETGGHGVPWRTLRVTQAGGRLIRCGWMPRRRRCS